MDFLDRMRTRAQDRRRGSYLAERLGKGWCFSQHDMDAANGSGATVRADYNLALKALASQSSGASAPGTTFAYQPWADTTAGVLKRRNAANTGWLVRDTIDEAFVVARSSNTILDNSDYAKAFIFTGTFTQTITAAATLGDGWWVELRNDGTGVITLDPNSSETIDGATTLKLNPREGCILACNGTSFYTISLGLVRGGVSYPDNLSLALSVGASALTIALKDRNGNDPTTANPIRVPFRNVTPATGDFAELYVTAATSIVVSSGSTLGTSNNVAFRLWIVAFNDGGTFRLGVINCLSATSIFPLAGWGIASSTAEGGAGAADSAHVFYTGTAVTSKAYTVLGYVTYESGLATAGTWSAVPTRAQLYGPGVPLPGQTIQHVSAEGSGSSTTSTTATDVTGTMSVTLTSAANIVDVRCDFYAQVSNVASLNSAHASQMLRGSTIIDGERLAYAISGTGGNGLYSHGNFADFDRPNSTSAQTYKLQHREGAGGGSGATVTSSQLKWRATELMA